MLVNHYLNGGWYPVGGASEIARHILPVIENAGGKAIARREVIEILIQDGVAIGVRAKKTHKPGAEIDYDFFAQWQEQPWKRRGEEYTELKDKLSLSLIKLVESKYSGFKDLIGYSELSTPLTVEYFDASDKGAIYGIAAIPKRLDADWIGARTPSQNLYLTGTDASGHGIVGAAIGGVVTAGMINGPFGFFKIMSALRG